MSVTPQKQQQSVFQSIHRKDIRDKVKGKTKINIQTAAEQYLVNIIGLSCDEILELKKA